jgi:two-component system, chemotaxis family, protein-glutamate methylesterase/glutaminase
VTTPAAHRPGGPVRLVVVGGSWGGAAAATELLRTVPAPLPVPVLLVLHRSRSSEAAVLERVLERDTGHPVREVGDKDELTAGTVHLAPPDYHVLVEGGSVSLSVEEHVNHSRPSLDLAFESAADEHGEALVAVLLSGLGRDGACGIVAVRRAGGRTLVQDPDEADRGDMPGAAIATGAVDAVAPVAVLGATVAALVGSPS